MRIVFNSIAPGTGKADTLYVYCQRLYTIFSKKEYRNTDVGGFNEVVQPDRFEGDGEFPDDVGYLCAVAGAVTWAAPP
jgi:hypothetical protein